MTLPSYVQFTGPLLQYLAEQDGPVRARVVYEALAQRLGLSDEDRTARLPSGRQYVLRRSPEMTRVCSREVVHPDAR